VILIMLYQRLHLYQIQMQPTVQCYIMTAIMN